MKLFHRRDQTTAGLERALQADRQADERLRESKATALWARNALDRNGFAEALILIMRGEAS